MVLLFNSKLRLFPKELKSKWLGPFQIKEVKPYGELELEDPVFKVTCTVNGQRVKIYLGGGVGRLAIIIPLKDP